MEKEREQERGNDENPFRGSVEVGEMEEGDQCTESKLRKTEAPDVVQVVDALEKKVVMTLRAELQHRA